MTNPQSLLLIDASGYLFRAYHALPKLSNSRGEPTGAVVGVLSMLRKLLDMYPEAAVAVVFDAAGRSFRNDLYPEYKANRPPPPNDLRQQIEPLHAVIRALGLALLAVPEVEADDVIGTLAAQASAAGMRTIISSGDKDMAQLVDEQVTLVNTMSESTLDPAGVKAKFGVPPERIVDYLALVGDTVDNVPGVPKCGPKTAIKWLAAHGDLDGVIAHAETIGGKIGEHLRAALPQLPLARELVTIKRDVELPLTLDELTPGAPDREALRTWYERLESRRLLASLQSNQGSATPPETTGANDGTEYTTILSEQAFEQWLQRLEKARLIAIDTETTALDYMQARLVGLSFTDCTEHAAYLPLAHDYLGAPPQLDADMVLARLKPLLEDPAHPKVGQNLKYDMSVLANHGIALRGVAHDTMLQSYVLDSTATRHDLDSLAKRYLGRTTTGFTEIAGKGAKQLTFNQIALEQAAPYAAEDAEVALRLHQVLWPRLTERPTQTALYREIEIPLITVLSRMERTGVRVDAELLAHQSTEIEARVRELEVQAHAQAGHAFNLGSPRQIGAILFDELGLPVLAKTPKGAPSTSEAVLEQLAEQGHALPDLILRHRTLAKLKSTYTDKLPRMINSGTGRVHTSYHQAVTATGRLSSSDPNLQNIPIRTEDGRRIRRAFVAEPGYCILAADYSQIELRIMAHLSGDERLLGAFAAGQDIHRATAAEILGLAPEEVSGEQRRSAKAINFGLIYGMSAFGLAKQLGINQVEAQDYVDRYFQRYPGVRAFMERTRQQAHADRYVETLFGRRLYLTDIDHSNQHRRAAAERTAINAPLQGTAADIIKRAMLAVDAWIESEHPPVRMIMQVHDELVFEVAQNSLDSATAAIVAAMRGAASLDVALEVDTGNGTNWDEAH